MPKKHLTAVSRTQGNNSALKNGEVALPDFELDFEEVSPLPKAFRRMVREAAYDVSEMALTTYICALARGVRITGLPIFLVRDFHHKSMARNRDSGIEKPKDLEGRRVGVKRGYTVTTGVWARTILADEYDVDLQRVTWARSDDEHVPDLDLPDNVEMLGGDGSLEEQLDRGTLPAAVGIPAAGEFQLPLIDNAFDAGMAALKSRGLYPINHLVVVRDDVLAENPGLEIQLFDAFSESKRRYVEDLKAGRSGEAAPTDRVHRAVMTVMDDPLPYGVEPNRAVLEMLLESALSQGLIDRSIPIEDLFAKSLLDRVG